jgi:TM2 domain-containing membrane protein YozV
MLGAHRRNPLLSWYIGLLLNLACVGIIAHQMYVTGCMAPTGAKLIVLVAIPAIYLTLMYLTLKSQP